MFLTKNKKKASDVLLEVLHILYLDKSYICSSRNDQMSMSYKHQLLIEERGRERESECHNDNSLVVFMYSVLCKVHEHAFIF